MSKLGRRLRQFAYRMLSWGEWECTHYQDDLEAQKARWSKGQGTLDPQERGVQMQRVHCSRSRQS